MKFINSDIEKFIRNYPSLTYDENKAKIICKWTNHEIPLKLDSIKEYVNGNRFKKLLQLNLDQNLLDQNSQFLVKSNKPKRENQLFCKLTWKHVNKQVDHIQKHLNGRRFQKALVHWNNCQETKQNYYPPGREPQAAKHGDNVEAPIGEDEEFEMVNYDDESSDDSEKHADDLEDLYPEELLGPIETNEDEEMCLDDDDDDNDDDEMNGKMKRKFNNNINSNKKNQPRKKKLK